MHMRSETAIWRLGSSLNFIKLARTVFFGFQETLTPISTEYSHPLYMTYSTSEYLNEKGIAKPKSLFAPSPPARAEQESFKLRTRLHRFLSGFKPVIRMELYSS